MLERSKRSTASRPDRVSKLTPMAATLRNNRRWFARAARLFFFCSGLSRSETPFGSLFANLMFLGLSRDFVTTPAHGHNCLVDLSNVLLCTLYGSSLAHRGLGAATAESDLPATGDDGPHFSSPTTIFWTWEAFFRLPGLFGDCWPTLFCDLFVALTRKIGLVEGEKGDDWSSQKAKST